MSSQQNKKSCCWLDLTSVCEPKENVPSTYFEYGGEIQTPGFWITAIGKAANAALPAVTNNS
jgi:hypothetical protein